MPRQSDTGNVKKRCACGRKKWSTCAHPWHVDYKAPKDHAKRPNGRLRKILTGPTDQVLTLADAKIEARRAIIVWLDGRDPDTIQPEDRPTLARVLEEYGKRPDAAAGDAIQIAPITTTQVKGKPFGEWAAADVTREALDAFRAQRPKIAANRNLALLRAMFNWAVASALLPRTPFRVGDVAVVKLTREEARSRRLQGDEESRLLEACLAGTDKRGWATVANPHLKDLIVAALETGCRKGELLSLQWHQVRFTPRAEIFLPAQKTKAKKDRRVPISSALKTVLDARRNDPAGEPLPASAYVFGDEVGRRHATIKTAWAQRCKRAKIVGLHFHDLRREAGSRWMDAGVPLATIQRWLGHHNISQTSTYLAASLGGDESTIMEAFERRIGRVPQGDISAGSNGSQPSSTDMSASENAEQNPIVH